MLITQWPQYVSSLPSSVAEMHCYQNDTDYEYHYWYRQTSEKGLQLIVYSVVGNDNFEEGFKSGFKTKRTSAKQWSLLIPSVRGEDAAVYLCAASQHSAVAELRPVTKTCSTDTAYCSHT